MYTIVETELFQTTIDSYLNHRERGELFGFLGNCPTAGDVIPGSGGCRKLRWALPGTGKSGGLRVIYVNYLADGEIVMLAAYSKTVVGTIPAHTLRDMKDALDEKHDDR